MEEYYIGYYPIKESEIKQIVKCVKLCSKDETETINNILDKHNCEDTIKENVLNNIKECINNKSEKVFDVRYGVCIAKLQKIYRHSFNMEKLSLTELITTNKSLYKYTKNWLDIFNFKQTKYQFINYLKFPKSSGVYIPIEKIEELYKNYYSDISIQNIINKYYGDNTEKFLKILSYCLDNNCGLLEATGICKIIKKAEKRNISVVRLEKEEESVKSKKNKENIKNTVNSEKENTALIVGKKHNIYNIKKDDIKNAIKEIKEVKFSKTALDIIGLFLLLSLSLTLVFYTIEKFIIFKNVNYMIVKAVISIIIQIPINILLWKYIMKIILKKRIILKEELKDIFIITIIFMVVYVAISLIMKTVIVKNQIEYETKFGEEILEKEIKYANYKISNTDESQKKLKKIEESLTDCKKNIYNEMYWYLTVYCVYIICINFSMIWYEQKVLKKNI